MTTAQLRPIAPQKLHFSENLSVWVSDAQCRLVVSQPALDPTLWNTYLQGALRAYSKHGVECTLDLDAISDGSDTQLFFAAIDIGGDVVGGARVIGPLRSADDSHAVVEWAGNPGLSAVRKMINDRAPFGVVEVKSGWVNSDAQRSDAIAAALARALPLSMSLLGVQFVMGTAAAHALDRWRSSGGVIAARIPAAQDRISHAGGVDCGPTTWTGRTTDVTDLPVCTWPPRPRPSVTPFRRTAAPPATRLSGTGQAGQRRARGVDLQVVPRATAVGV